MMSSERIRIGVVFNKATDVKYFLSFALKHVYSVCWTRVLMLFRWIGETKYELTSPLRVINLCPIRLLETQVWFLKHKLETQS